MSQYFLPSYSYPVPSPPSNSFSTLTHRAGSEAQGPNHHTVLGLRYGYVSTQWPSVYKCSTFFLQWKGDSRAQSSLLYTPEHLWQLCRPSTESGCSYRCHLTLLAHSFTISLSCSFQTVGWMASHFDDLFKQFVRSTTSCTHMIQNINACCRCNFSCLLMHQEKMTFISERDAISLQIVTCNALVKQSAGSGKSSNNNNANVSFNWIGKWFGGPSSFLNYAPHGDLRSFT